MNPARVLLLCAALCLVPASAQAARNPKTGPASWSKTPLPGQTLQLKKPVVISPKTPTVPRVLGMIPVGTYRPKRPRVFGRFRTTICVSPWIIRRVIRRHVKAVKACYRRHVLKTSPRLGGRTNVSFTVDTKGRVSAVKLQGRVFRKKAARRCLIRVFRAMRFPATGAIVHVRYPYLFRAK